MARIIWQENDLVSFKLRDDLYTIGQLLASPFVRFFDIQNYSGCWQDINLDSVSELFTVLVVNQVFRELAIGKIKDKSVKASSQPLERKWIKPHVDMLGESPPDQFLFFGGKLVELATRTFPLNAKPELEDFPQISPSHAPTIIENLTLPQHRELIEKYELTNMWAAEELSERLCRYFDNGINRDDLKFEVFPALYSDREKLRPLTSRLPEQYR